MMDKEKTYIIIITYGVLCGANTLRKEQKCEAVCRASRLMCRHCFHHFVVVVTLFLFLKALRNVPSTRLHNMDFLIVIALTATFSPFFLFFLNCNSHLKKKKTTRRNLF